MEMERVIECSKRYLKNLDGEDAARANRSWRDALSEFVQANSSRFSFIDRYGLDTKEEFLRTLADRIIGDQGWDPEVKALAFSCLRLCCREIEGLYIVQTPEMVQELFKLTHLDDGEYPTSEDSAGLKMLEEAAKALVNVLLVRKEAMLALYLDLDCPTKLVIALSSDKLPMCAYFPFCRLLVHFAMNPEIKEQLIANNVLTILTDRLEDVTAKIEEPDNVRNAKEILEVIFLLTGRLGPLEGAQLPTEAELASYKRLVALFQIYLFLPMTEEFHPLKATTVKNLINVPAACTNDFDHDRTLLHLIEFLKYQAFKPGDSATNLTPILLILSSIARGIPRARPILKEIVFPDSDHLVSRGADPPEELKDFNTLSGRLLSQMTSSNFALHHYVCDFLFVICDEDPDELIRLTGLGNAAGLLAQNKLFNKLAQGASPGSSSSQFGGSSSSSSSSSSSGSQQQQQEPSEEDAQRIYELMQKLERQGLIKVVRKNPDEQQ